METKALSKENATHLGVQAKLVEMCHSYTEIFRIRSVVTKEGKYFPLRGPEIQVVILSLPVFISLSNDSIQSLSSPKFSTNGGLQILSYEQLFYERLTRHRECHGGLLGGYKTN